MRISVTLRRFGAVLIAATTAITHAATVGATDKELLDTLLENGAITRSQYERLLGPEDAPAAVPAAPPKGEPDAAAPRSATVSLDRRGLNIESADGAFEMKIGGRLHAQASGHRGDDDLPADDEATDGAEIRRARIEMKGTVYGDWPWVAEVDFANNDVSIKDFTLGYTGLPVAGFFIGHQKQPYSLAVEMSSNDLPFIERGVDNYLIIPFIDRAIGLRGDASGEHWFFAAGFYGESIEPSGLDDEGWGTAGRFVVAPIVSDRAVLHVALRASYRQPSTSDDTTRLRDETTNMSNLRIVDTGEIEGVHDVVLLGPEAAVAYGPFSLFGEFNQAYLSRRSSPDLDFQSWHVGATLSVTGESRAAAYRIDAGEFKRIHPNEDFALRGGGWGAWEVAERLAAIDLNDGPVTGGDEMVAATAINWYVNPIVRFMFEWSHVVDTDDSNAVRVAAEGMDIFQVRGQVTF
jgi:phosphate-selective porin OprO/OprP